MGPGFEGRWANTLAVAARNDERPDAAPLPDPQIPKSQHSHSQNEPPRSNYFVCALHSLLDGQSWAESRLDISVGKPLACPTASRGTRH